MERLIVEWDTGKVTTYNIVIFRTYKKGVKEILLNEVDNFVKRWDIDAKRDYDEWEDKGYDEIYLEEIKPYGENVTLEKKEMEIMCPLSILVKIYMRI